LMLLGTVAIAMFQIYVVFIYFLIKFIKIYKY